MKVIKNDPLPTPEKCAGSLRDILDAMYVLNGKWKLALILSLIISSKRFNEIQQEITGISAKVLAKELKDLEENDLIVRRVYATTPVTIIYEATDYSRTLKNVLAELGAWGGRHRAKVKDSMRKQS